MSKSTGIILILAILLLQVGAQGGQAARHYLSGNIGMMWFHIVLLGVLAGFCAWAIRDILKN